jgi:hypothetical protein
VVTERERIREIASAAAGAGFFSGEDAGVRTGSMPNRARRG